MAEFEENEQVEDEAAEESSGSRGSSQKESKNLDEKAGKAAAKGAEKGAQQAAAKSITGPVMGCIGELLVGVLIVVMIIVVIGAVIAIFAKVSGADVTDPGGGTAGTYAMPFDRSFYDNDGTPRTHHNYAALDLSLPTGTELYAITDGEVTYACNTVCDTRGSAVEILGRDGMKYRYFHMLPGTLAVNEGENVTAGSFIGKSDNTGNSTGAHLHFEVNCGDPDIVPVECFPGERFPHNERCGGDNFSVQATGPWKLIEAIRDGKPVSGDAAPWARYGACPSPPGDGA